MSGLGEIGVQERLRLDLYLRGCDLDYYTTKSQRCRCSSKIVRIFSRNKQSGPPLVKTTCSKAGSVV